MEVGFIGLGNIGAPMARRLGSESDGATFTGLTVFDVDKKALQTFVDQGATAATNPGELARRCDRICIVVQNEDQVRAVLTAESGILSAANPGTIVAVHSTMSPQGAVELAQLCQEVDVEFIDAPISGGALGAHDGTLAVMVGGPSAAVETMRPVFEKFSTLIVHTGDVGSATQTKIARNLITFVSFAAVGEAQRLLEEAGINIQPLGDIVRHSDRITGGPGAIMLRDSAQPMQEDDGLQPIFRHTSELGHKDLELAIDLGVQLDIATPFARLAKEHLDQALGLK